MTIKEKKEALRKNIADVLSPLIGRRCVVLDVPYHVNIGDLLIWKGEMDFLKSLGVKISGMYSADTFRWPKLPKTTTILLNGGGNFGDIWRYFQDFKLQVVEHYPNNRIVFLPQTIWYTNEQKEIEDMELLRKHSDLHICVRDKQSLSVLQKHFNTNIYLAPDMAFCISDNFIFNKKSLRIKYVNLYVKRSDPEAKESTLDLNFADAEIRDWPTMEKVPCCYKIFIKLRTMNAKLMHVMERLPYFHKHGFKTQLAIEDFYMLHVCLPNMLRQGIKFVSSYKYIYTTRLHVAILSTLLEKGYTFLDNNYGKNSSFYETWLSDVEEIVFRYDNK